LNDECTLVGELNSMSGLLWLVVCLLVIAFDEAKANYFDVATAILEDGVSRRVFPGAVGLVGDKSGILYQVSVGSLTYDNAPTPLGLPNAQLTRESVFDMASCSKVVATTTAVAYLDQEGLFGPMGLDTPVEQLLSGFGTNGKMAITLRNCLLHNAGFPPDPTPIMFWNASFGCAGAPVPSLLSFGCSGKIYQAVLTQELRRNATIGGAYVYSDLSFITLMYAVGHVAITKGLVTEADFLPACSICSKQGVGCTLQCSFEAFVRLKVFAKLRMKKTQYLPPPSLGPKCVPTTVPTSEDVAVDLQGRVEDGNAYNMGGVAGHAGLFSTVDDLSTFMRELMYSQTFLNGTTVKRFTTQWNHSQSSRALGWNTNDITAQPDGGWNLSCGNLSAQTFTHVGYTGTQVCGDPVRGVYTVLLTARVYGGDERGSTGIHAVRKSWNSEVAAAVDRGLTDGANPV